MKLYERTIKVSHTESSTELLGPYNRFIIWVHGCCFDCKGCLAENYRNGIYQEIKIKNLAEEIISSDTEGITISGGEPFLQADELSELIEYIRKKRDIGVIVYSGFTVEELLQRKDSAKLLLKTDILIDGRYIQELDDERPYVGSSNQRIIYLTNRYKEIGKNYYFAEKRKMEIKLYSNRAVMIGVPSREQLKAWNDLKNNIGRD